MFSAHTKERSLSAWRLQLCTVELNFPPIRCTVFVILYYRELGAGWVASSHVGESLLSICMSAMLLSVFTSNMTTGNPLCISTFRWPLFCMSDCTDIHYILPYTIVDNGVSHFYTVLPFLMPVFTSYMIKQCH